MDANLISSITAMKELGDTFQSSPKKPVKIYPPYPVVPPNQKQLAKEYYANSELGKLLDLYA